MGVDEALLGLGRFGKWQLMHHTCIGFVFCLPGAWQMFSVVFIGYAGAFHCKPYPNKTLEESVPQEKDPSGAVTWSQCNAYLNKTLSNQTIPCPNGWEYRADGFGPTDTITTEWDLVCEKGFYVNTAQTIFMTGTMVGAIIFTPFADKYGRKKIFFLTQFLMIVLGIVKAFSPNFIAFCVFQFFSGAFSQGVAIAGFVLCCEMFPAQMRTYMAPSIYLIWATGMMTLPIWAYFIRSWRILQLAISASPLVTLIYYWFCPESLRWLMASDKLVEAEDILRKAAETNKVEVPMSDLYVLDPFNVSFDPSGSVEHLHPELAIDYFPTNHIETNISCDRINSDFQIVSRTSSRSNISAASSKDTTSTTIKETNIKKLFQSRKCLRYMILMTILVFINAFMYFGLSLMTGILPGNIYVNFFITASIEVPATIGAILLSQFFGRRKPLCFFHIFSGVLFIAAGIISFFPGMGSVLTALAITGKFGVAGAWAVELNYAQEIFPTVLRSIGLGLVSAIGMVGSILAPYASYLAKISPPVPIFIFGAFSLVGAVLVLFQLETHGRPLPTTIAQIESWALTPTQEEIEKFQTSHKKKSNLTNGTVVPQNLNGSHPGGPAFNYGGTFLEDSERLKKTFASERSLYHYESSI